MKQKYYTIIFIALQVLFMSSVRRCAMYNRWFFSMDEVSLEKEISIKVSGNEVRDIEYVLGKNWKFIVLQASAFRLHR